MTVGVVNSVGLTRIEPVRAIKGLGNSIHLIEMHNRESLASLPSAPCRSAYTVGRYEQHAHADAISRSHDVILAARDKESDSGKRAALEKSLGRIGHTPQEAYGPRVMNKLTLFGAVLKAVEHALAGAPDNKALVARKHELESAIVKVGLRAGLCKGIADGGYHGDKPSDRLGDALKQGQDVVLACRQTMGDSVLMDGIVSAVLPGAMMQSLRDRMPNVAEQYQGRMQELDLMQVLQKQRADDTWSTVEHQMQTGCPEAFACAVFNLLKLPEYVMEGEPAGPAPEQPAATPVPDGRFPPIPAMPPGGNQAINQNIVDNSGFGKTVSELAGKLASISNLTQKDVLALGVDLGRLDEQNAFLKGENADLRTRNTALRNENVGLRNENKDFRNRLEDLERKFDDMQQRLHNWNQNSTCFETMRGASNHADSGHGSVFGGDHIDEASAAGDNQANIADTDADGLMWGSVATGPANDAVGLEGPVDPDAARLIARLEDLRGFSSKRGNSTAAGSPALNGAVQSGANLTGQVVSVSSPVSGSQQTHSLASLPVVAVERLQTSALADQDALEGIRRIPVEGDSAEAIEQSEVNAIVFHGLENEINALWPDGIPERTDAQNVNVTADHPQRPNTRQPQLRRLESGRSVRELIARFEPSPRSSRASSVEVVERADVNSMSTGLASEQVLPASKLLAGVQSSVATGPIAGIREEFEALRDFRTDQGAELSAIGVGDPFREYWRSIGGLAFSPPVPPTGRNKQAARIPSELEQVNDRLAANRARNSARLLKEVFPQKTPYGRTMRDLADAVDLALQSNPVFASDDAGESAATATAGTVPDDNTPARVTEPQAQATRKLFNRVGNDYLLRRFPPTVVGPMPAS